jgi:hypothetical protein
VENRYMEVTVKKDWYHLIEKLMLLGMAGNAMKHDMWIAVLVYAWIGLWVFSGDAWRCLFARGGV